MIWKNAGVILEHEGTTKKRQESPVKGHNYGLYPSFSKYREHLEN